MQPDCRRHRLRRKPELHVRRVQGGCNVRRRQARARRQLHARALRTLVAAYSCGHTQAHAGVAETILYNCCACAGTCVPLHLGPGRERRLCALAALSWDSCGHHHPVQRREPGEGRGSMVASVVCVLGLCVRIHMYMCTHQDHAMLHLCHTPAMPHVACIQATADDCATAANCTYSDGECQAAGILAMGPEEVRPPALCLCRCLHAAWWARIHARKAVKRCCKRRLISNYCPNSSADRCPHAAATPAGRLW